MANIARSVFFAALAAMAMAAVAGRFAGLVVCGVVAILALVAFTRTTKEHIIPSPRVGIALTKAGWGSVFFVVFVLVSAIQSGANLLFFLASALIGVIAAAVLYAPFSLRRTTMTVLAPSWGFAGEAATAQAQVSNAKRILPIVALRISGRAGGNVAIAAAVPVLPAGASARLEFPVTPSARGVVHSAALELSTIGPVGLVSRARTFDAPFAMTVYPSLAQVALPPIPRRRQERGRAWVMREGEFAGLREWRPGDSPRHIHWRSSARVGRLVSKEFVQSERPEVAVILDTFGEEGEALEAAVSRAAGYAVAAARASFKVRLVYFDTALRTVEDDAAGGLPHKALKCLAEVRAQKAASFEVVARRFEAGGLSYSAAIEVRIGAAPAEVAHAG